MRVCVSVARACVSGVGRRPCSHPSRVGPEAALALRPLARPKDSRTVGPSFGQKFAQLRARADQCSAAREGGKAEHTHTHTHTHTHRVTTVAGPGASIHERFRGAGTRGPIAPPLPAVKHEWNPGRIRTQNKTCARPRMSRSASVLGASVLGASVLGAGLGVSALASMVGVVRAVACGEGCGVW